MEKTLEEIKRSMKEITDTGLNASNLKNMSELVDMYKDIKEVECMQYGNYGNYGGYNGPGYDAYGRRGYDMKYRGEGALDAMRGNYRAYSEGKEAYGRGNYGAKEETDKSFHYMIKALEDFIMVLHEEADTEQQRQMLRQTLQNSMR